MNWALTLASFTAALGILFLVVISTRLRQRRRVDKRNEIVRRATEQLKETSIFIRIAADHGPEDVKKLQDSLQRAGRYYGPLDGVANPELINSMRRLAEERGTDLEAEALDMFARSSYAEEMPPVLQKELLLKTAQSRLAEAKISRRLRA